MAQREYQAVAVHPLAGEVPHATPDSSTNISPPLDISTQKGPAHLATENSTASSANKSFTLYVRFIPANTTMEELVGAFRQFGEILPTTRIFSIKRIAFVDFASEAALCAAEKSTIRMRNSNIRVERAKFTERRTESRKPRNGKDLENKLGQSLDSDLSPGFSSTKRCEENGSNGESSTMSVSVATLTSDDSSFRPKTDIQSNNSSLASRTPSPAPAVQTIMRSIYLASIPVEISIGEVESWISSTLAGSPEGKFRSVRNMNSKGLRQGFIDFPDLEQAKAALTKLRANSVLKGCQLPLELARPLSPSQQQRRVRADAKAVGSSLYASATSTPPQQAPQSKLSEKPMYYVRINSVPPGATREELYRGYIPFGKIRQIVFKTLEANAGELESQSSIGSPEEPKRLLASLTFGNVEDAVKAVSASKSAEVDGLEVIRDGDSCDVVVGPFSAERTLSQIAHLLAKFGSLNGAKLVQKTTACVLIFENEKAAKRACETAVVVKGVSLLGEPESYSS